MIRNLCCTVTIDSVLSNSKKQNAFLFTVNAIFRHDYPLAVEPASTPRPLLQKKLGTDSLPIDMLLSAVSVLVVAQSSSEVPEGLMNNTVCYWAKQNTDSWIPPLCPVSSLQLTLTRPPKYVKSLLNLQPTNVYFWTRFLTGE